MVIASNLLAIWTPMNIVRLEIKTKKLMITDIPIQIHMHYVKQMKKNIRKM